MFVLFPTFFYFIEEMKRCWSIVNVDENPVLLTFVRPFNLSLTNSFSYLSPYSRAFRKVF